MLSRRSSRGEDLLKETLFLNKLASNYIKNNVNNKNKASINTIRFIDETGLKFIIGSTSKRNIINGLAYELNDTVDLIENELFPLIDKQFTYTNPRTWK